MKLRVPLKWTSPEGVEVTKTLIFRRGSYRVDVQYEVKNTLDDGVDGWRRTRRSCTTCRR